MKSSLIQCPDGGGAKGGAIVGLYQNGGCDESLSLRILFCLYSSKITKKIGKLHIWEPRPLEEQILEVLDMQEISTDVAKKIKMSREAELNMERCAEFMARMIQKYGKKILDDIAAESNEQPEQPKRDDKVAKKKCYIWLNDNGYRRMVKGQEKAFTSDFVKGILKNPFYCGKLMFNRRTNLKGSNIKPKEPICVEGKHEAIVSEEQWQLVQDKREELSSWGEKTEDFDRISLLCGLAKCPACGGGLVHMKNKSINRNKGGYYKTLHYYSCRNYRKAEGRTCSFKHTYNQEKVDSAIYEIVSNLHTMPQFREAVDTSVGDKPTLESYEAEMKELRKQLHFQEHLKYKLGNELDKHHTYRLEMNGINMRETE